MAIIIIIVIIMHNIVVVNKEYHWATITRYSCWFLVRPHMHNFTYIQSCIITNISSLSYIHPLSYELLNDRLLSDLLPLHTYIPSHIRTAAVVHPSILTKEKEEEEQQEYDDYCGYNLSVITVVCIVWISSSSYTLSWNIDDIDRYHMMMRCHRWTDITWWW